ncbi:shikimate dehydrogenase family protein [Sinomicrobium weinanense]|uniref:Shikimate dehydrogenase n=1 Tax=Sinomicrobium weinanense TaxID=2842200 RepID=A0A926JVR4_9FLAO|nr:shikimate dehydrogenase [Sinomicrobium weinanense]MBC9798209.1 shikimate dehydrogenase [Sinomicrobium weinanense]MBU3122867.1 shikimate dehydrogenase [Sinomicrobium weinanense]
MPLFGLVGKNISYSFSQVYFREKFEKLQLADHSYVNFDIPKIEDFPSLIRERSDIRGFNVTIPYKEAVIPYLSGLSNKAEQIGAVNVIKVGRNDLTGYNTDYYGFQASLQPLLHEEHRKALILGTGGASKAVAFSFEELGIDHTFVSRSPAEGQLSYKDLNEDILGEYLVIVNCTPLGTFPNTENKPDIPYQHITPKHLLYDLIYNPAETLFLKEGKQRGATISNGLKMLQLQAEKAWEIWNSPADGA